MHDDKRDGHPRPPRPRPRPPRPEIGRPARPEPRLPKTEEPAAEPPVAVDTQVLEEEPLAPAPPLEQPVLTEEKPEVLPENEPAAPPEPAPEAPPEPEPAAGAPALQGAAWPVMDGPVAEDIETQRYLPPNPADMGEPLPPVPPPAPQLSLPPQGAPPDEDELEVARRLLAKKRRREGVLLEWTAALFIALFLCIVLTQVVLVCARVPSQSMAGTIHSGDSIVGLRLAYLGRQPQRYDVIIFKFPDDESQYYVKRVIGLPGEEVEIRDGEVYINGEAEPLDSSFVKGRIYGNFGPYQVPENKFFVLGDNRAESWDSRYWNNTYVDKMQIIGRVVYRLYPNTGRVG